MNVVIWLVVGGIVGWVASKVMNTDEQQGLMLNVVVGVVGALIGGWVLSPIVGVATINQGDFSIGGLFVSLVGAIALLTIVKYVGRQRAR